jgi:hypothetical protein
MPAPDADETPRRRRWRGRSGEPGAGGGMATHGGDEEGRRDWLRSNSRPMGATSDPRLLGATLPMPRRISLEALGQPSVRDDGDD